MSVIRHVNKFHYIYDNKYSMEIKALLQYYNIVVLNIHSNSLEEHYILVS